MKIHHSVLENETHNSNEKSGSPTREGPRLDLRRLKWASGLSPETLHEVLARQRSGQNHLHRHDASEFSLPGLVNHAHAAPRNLLQQIVLAERSQW